MKKIFFFVLSTFAFCNMYGQNIIFHAGCGLTTLNGHDSKNIGTFKIGVSWEQELSQTLTVEPGLLFFSKGWKENNQTVTIYDYSNPPQPVLDDMGNPKTGIMNITCKTNYLVVPVLLNYYIPLDLPHYIYLSAGPYIAYGFGGNTRISGDTSQKTEAQRRYYDIRTFDQKQTHRFDAGVCLGAGYEFNRSINAGIEGHFGLTDTYNKGKNLSVLLTLGYRLNL